jgi:4-hydroxymandelate oxidase
MRDVTRMKIVLKGIITAEDAQLAVQNGIDGILVSNHGGRGEDNGRSTIDALPEIIAAVNGQMPVIVDSGFRRGTDVVKALAMGAKRSGSAGPISGASAPSARKVSSGCWSWCAPRPAPPCSNAARAR